jgi:hypothetical protein
MLQSGVTASPAVVTANGTDISTITVTLRDVDGAAVPGKQVSLSANGGSSDIAVVREISDDEGRAVFTVKNAKAEQVAYTAKVVTLRDGNGMPVSGKRIALAQDGSSRMTFVSDISDSLGIVQFTATNETAEQVAYTALLPEAGATLSQQATVTFESAPVKTGGSKTSVLDSTVVASPEVVTANGIEVSTITVTLKDSEGMPVSGKTVSLTPNGGSSVIEAEGGLVVSDASGQVKFKVTNAKAEQIVYTAKRPGQAGNRGQTRYAYGR